MYDILKTGSVSILRQEEMVPTVWGTLDTPSHTLSEKN
jgi:hypothetical protein